MVYTLSKSSHPFEAENFLIQRLLFAKRMMLNNPKAR